MMRSKGEDYYRIFFSRLMERLDGHYPVKNLKARKITGKPFCSFPTGKSEYRYYIAFRGDNRLSCELYIDSNDRETNMSELQRLMERRNEIERLTGKLSWEPLETKRACRIAAYRTISSDDEMLEWAAEKLGSFRKAFGTHM